MSFPFSDETGQGGIQMDRTTIRFLLPFTGEIDSGAIQAAVEVAQWCGATLVPLSLICFSEMPETEDRRLEGRRKAHAFQDVVYRYATPMQVAVEGDDLFTCDVRQSIHLFAQEMECIGILLFVCEGTGVLLETDEVRQVVQQEKSALLYLVDLIPKAQTISLQEWLSSHFQKQKLWRLSSREKKYPFWYKVALLGWSLIITGLVILNTIATINEPSFEIVTLITRVVFVLTLSVCLFAILQFFLNEWKETRNLL